MKTVYESEPSSLEEVKALLAARESFEIKSLKIGDTVRIVEQQIDKLGMKSRVFTVGRKAALLASFWGPTAVAGIASAVGMSVHNIATWSPDYEIGKNRLKGTVSVIYKRKLKSIE
ncbi:hypothetical protein FM042_09240 [Aliidiomarina halalkaliphila]|uniref:Uncharacterized protein n=1 Tax=Aliidiomarina halalkaliphila TaxID=2593535 RepID=A0A552X017_9GAMM|nr:hypothetical protein [Aliidiomarina halalkaliphila]TRW48354.1 hypothetical protein FM042_09240 [Aliidiomarina halalkaliphila]